MVGLPGRRAHASAGTADFSSRLLPKILDEQKLEKLQTLNVLDFGRAYGPSLELFNRYSCRLCVLDLAEPLLEWSASLAEYEELPSNHQLEAELGSLLAQARDVRFDLLFLWDTLNHVHPHALTAFASVLKRSLAPGFVGHGFLLHKRGVEQKLRSMGLKDEETIALRDEKSADLYAPNRKVVNEALGADLHIDHGVLHGDGRLEFMMVNGCLPKRSAAGNANDAAR